jgi:hypothetical protein
MSHSGPNKRLKKQKGEQAMRKMLMVMVCLMMSTTAFSAIEYEWSDGKIVSILEVSGGVEQHRLDLFPAGIGAGTTSDPAFTARAFYSNSAGAGLDIHLDRFTLAGDLICRYRFLDDAAGDALIVSRRVFEPDAIPGRTDQDDMPISMVSFSRDGATVIIGHEPTEDQFFALYGLPIGPNGELTGGFVSDLKDVPLYEDLAGFYRFCGAIPLSHLTAAAFELRPLFFDPDDLPGEASRHGRAFPADFSKAMIDGNLYDLSWPGKTRDDQAPGFPKPSGGREEQYHGGGGENPFKDCMDRFMECLQWESDYYYDCITGCYDTWGESSAWRLSVCIWGCDTKDSILFWVCFNRFLNCLYALLFPPIVPW